MNVKALFDVLEPIRYVCDVNAIVPEYRRVYIKPGRLQARAAHAGIDAMIDFGIDEPFAVDFNLMFPLVRSLRSGGAKDVEFTPDGTALRWKAGASIGRLAVAEPKEQSSLPRQPRGGIANSPELVRMLDLGSLACTNSALQSIGLHGMCVLEDSGRAWCVSSDNVSIAAACMPIEPNQLLPGVTTIAPQDAQLLAMLADRDAGKLVFADNKISYADQQLRAVVHPIPPLKYDLFSLAAPNIVAEHVAALPHDRIRAFVQRATALTESREHCFVVVHASDNQIKLEFQENRASSEEVYLLDSVQLSSPCNVMVDAAKLGKALQNCDQLLLDNMHKKILAFRATDESFFYCLAGRG